MAGCGAEKEDCLGYGDFDGALSDVFAADVRRIEQWNNCWNWMEGCYCG